MTIPKIIAKELNISKTQVASVLNLFEDEATVPFIARYRKEKTGGLDEEVLRAIQERHTYLILLEERKETVLKSIEEQGKLTEELKSKIIAAEKLQTVEDLYLPYKPKRKTRGTIAKAKGLEPLALFILQNPNSDINLKTKCSEFIDAEKEVADADEALKGARDIIAEMISETAEVRNVVRKNVLNSGKISSQKVKKAEETKKKKDVYEIYHEFEIDVNKIKPHQVLAMVRGEKEKFLSVSFGVDKPTILSEIFQTYFEYDESVFKTILEETVNESYTRLIFPAIEREVRNILIEKSELHAIEIFAKNLRQLLLQPPISGNIILGIDPGFVSGSKIAVIDKTGKYLAGETIYPHPPQKKYEQAKSTLLEFINKYNVNIIAIGNGTASRETELMVAELIKENNLDCHYLIVSEAGASVYSASPLAKEEFPDLEASQRGNISIARRVLDPLAELVKIDPKAIGVGLYQHDVNQKQLSKKLDEVVESCVNFVGVDLNTASASLLTYVSGLNKRLAKRIVEARNKRGKFSERNQLLEVPGLGEKTYEQAAGFLKIPDGNNPLENTFIHPESYQATTKLLNLFNIEIDNISEKGSSLKLVVDNKGILKVAKQIGIGELTLKDILENLSKPGRDPRDEAPKPILRADVLSINDLQKGMVLKGTVRNVVDFGAFVDIGVKHDGLLHISKITKRFIKHPMEILKVGDIIDVTIINIEKEKSRISLSMLKSKSKYHII